ncbi:MAG: glycosyltransferase [Candidatus Omnitrophica bacterium]|nr:glycosyltransferase [Candidatus Omnitrophota bacterium]
MPKVSVITPCYNSEKYIGETIKSVYAQSFTDWEHIIVDDGSTDRSGDVVGSHAVRDGRIRFLSQLNQGVSTARNNGFKTSSKMSRYLLFLDADDTLEPLMLEKMVGYMDSRPEVGLARCEYGYIDSEGQQIDYPDQKARYVPWGLWLRKLGRDEPETPFLSVFTLCGIVPSVALIRRSVYGETQGFDETFGHHHEDTDLFLHIALKSKVHFVSELLARRRRHPGQNTEDSPEFRKKARLQEEKLYAKWNRGEGLTGEKKKRVREAWAFKQGRLEPYLTFQRAFKCWKKKDFGMTLRLTLSGSKQYLVSLIPGSPF